MSDGQVFPVPAAWAERAHMDAAAYEAACALAAGSDRSDAFDLGRGPESLLALWQQADGANDLLV